LFLVRVPGSSVVCKCLDPLEWARRQSGRGLTEVQSVGQNGSRGCSGTQDFCPFQGLRGLSLLRYHSNLAIRRFFLPGRWLGSWTPGWEKCLFELPNCGLPALTRMASAASRFSLAYSSACSTLRVRHVEAATHVLPVADRRFRSAVSRASIAVFTRASASFSVPMICSSVNLARQIYAPFSGPESKRSCRKLMGLRHGHHQGGPWQAKSPPRSCRTKLHRSSHGR